MSSSSPFQPPKRKRSLPSSSSSSSFSQHPSDGNNNNARMGYRTTAATRHRNSNSNSSNTDTNSQQNQQYTTMTSSNNNNNNNNNRNSSPSKHKKQQPLYKRRLSLLTAAATCLLLRLVWSMGVLHARVLNTTRSATMADKHLQWDGRNNNNEEAWWSSLRLQSQQQQQQQQKEQRLVQGEIQHERHQERRQRINNKNQQQQKQLPAAHDWNTMFSPPFQVSTLHSDLPWNASSFPFLCQQAHLTPDSHVQLVLLPSSSSSLLAVPLALVLGQYCRVQHLTLVHEWFPNTPQHTLDQFETMLRPVMRTIPHVHLPHHDTTSFNGNNKNDLPPTTHVVFLNQPRSTATTTRQPWKDYMTESNHRLYVLETTRQQVLQQLANLQQVEESSPQVLYVTSQQADASTTDTLLDRLLQTLLHSYDRQPYYSHQQLELPPVRGPLAITTNHAIALNHALAAILVAWQPRNSKDTITRWTVPQMTTLVQHEIVPPSTKTASNHSPVQRAAEQYHEALELRPTLFPCASSCRHHHPTSLTTSEQNQCSPSAWDTVVPLSQAATHNCTYVVHYSNLDSTLNTLVRPLWRDASSGICRVAFVAEQSPLVTRIIQNYQQSTWNETNTTHTTQVNDELLTEWNGKLEFGGWKVVWVPSDESSLNDADSALPVIDPSRLFAPQVHKTLYTDAPEFAQSSDKVLLRILKNMDRPAILHPVKKEYRGKEFRWVQLPPKKASKVLLFVGEMGEIQRPANATAFAQYVREYVTLPPAQVEYYERLAQTVLSEDNRPVDDYDQDATFPYLWASLAVMSHDLEEAEAQRLRCEWFEEYLYWGSSNRQVEELSLAFVLARRRLRGELGQPNPDAPTFVPLWSGVEQDQYDLFLRVLQRRD